MPTQTLKDNAIRYYFRPWRDAIIGSDTDSCPSTLEERVKLSLDRDVALLLQEVALKNTALSTPMAHGGLIRIERYSHEGNPSHPVFN